MNIHMQNTKEQLYRCVFDCNANYNYSFATKLFSLILCMQSRLGEFASMDAAMSNTSMCQGMHYSNTFFVEVF